MMFVINYLATESALLVHRGPNADRPSNYLSGQIISALGPTASASGGVRDGLVGERPNKRSVRSMAHDRYHSPALSRFPMLALEVMGGDKAALGKTSKEVGRRWAFTFARPE